MNSLIQTLAFAIEDSACTYHANYPGFHSNELHSALGSKVTSRDEKNAFAYAWGCSMAGKRAAVSFKNVGLTDAADAFLGALFVGCRAGLVLFLFDDCDIQHSQNRVDIRPYFLIHGGLWFEPRTVSDAYELTKLAFEKSEEFEIPVVIRITNILFDMGITPTKIERSKLPPREYAPLGRHSDQSRYVVHPSEAHRMEKDLEEKKRQIEIFVESLYQQQNAPSYNDIIFGAKRNVPSLNAFRLYTLPLPVQQLKRAFLKKPLENITVYEHGATPFIKQLVDNALSTTPGVRHKNMNPSFNLKAKYHNNTFMEKLFSVLRSIPRSVVCGDLGGYTMDPHRTLQLCLCYGTSPAVAMGVADVQGEEFRVFCITGDAAYLHSGQCCLHEMLSRKINISIFVLENGGALGTGGQHINGDLDYYPQGISFFCVDYKESTPDSLKHFVQKLPTKGINLILINTHEHELENNSH